MVFLAVRRRTCGPRGRGGADCRAAYGVWRERTTLSVRDRRAVVQPNLGFREKVASRDQDA